MLSGRCIEQYISSGEIVIDPLVLGHVGVNSVDLTLSDELLVYTDDVLDMRLPNPTRSIYIPPEGLVLEPGQLYLGATKEIAGTHSDFVPCIDGRSSVGRLGLFVHVTAGYGDVGFAKNWTLEIVPVKRIRVYAGVRICQIYFFRREDLQPPDGRVYTGKYAQMSTHPEPSRLHLDFE